MSTTIIVGAQWGDEAKGKLVDVLSDQADLVVRFSGGNNAGHTVMVGDETFKFQLLPAGILRPDVTSIIAGGVALCPKGLLDELAQVQSQRSELGKLIVSPTAHVVFPYHRQLDSLEEAARGQNKIGTTSRGIGPMYQDKVARTGIRVGELVDPKVFSERAREVIEVKNRQLAMFGEGQIDTEAFIAEYLAYGQRLKPYVADAESLLQDAVKRGDKVLFEGAQGTFLDLDHGTYPYVTSSHPIAGGACIGTGIGPRDIDNVLGVCKAYTTRVGSGPFPTEDTGEQGDAIRVRGHEFGTNTGRPRRCGWLDLVALRYACRVNSLSGLVITRLDVLSGLGPLKLCTGYGPFANPPTLVSEWQSVEPSYEPAEGWDEDVTSCKKWDDLPLTMQRYVRRIEEFTNTPAAVLSIGPKRDQTVVLRENLLW